MPAPIEMFTTPVVVPAGGLTLGMVISATFSGVPKTLSSTTPYPILPAGTYGFFPFLAKTNALLRQWILDVAAAQGITTRPALANVLLKFVLPSTFVPTANGNKINVTFTTTGFAIGAGVMLLTAASLDNTSGFWTKLGQVRDALTTKNADVLTTGVATWNGQHQPSYLQVFERQGEDQGDMEEAQGNTRVLRDNTVRQHVFGSTKVDRVVRLFEHEAPMLGGPLPIMTFSSINGARTILTLATLDENGLTNASNLYQNEDLVVLGNYIRVGLSRHVTRLDAKSGAPKTTSATLFEAASPNAAAQMVAGMTVFRVSEFEMLMRRVLDFGYVIYHEPNDTTQQVRFKGEAYALMIAGSIKVTPRRVDKFFDLYEVTLLLVRRDVPELVL
jgi:hypothetical protein